MTRGEFLERLNGENKRLGWPAVTSRMLGDWVDEKILWGPEHQGRKRVWTDGQFQRAIDICCIRAWGLKSTSALRFWFWLEGDDHPIPTIRKDLLGQYSRRRNRTLRGITTTVDLEQTKNLKPKRLRRAAKQIYGRVDQTSLLNFPAADVDVIEAYKGMRAAGDGDFRPMLKGLVSHIGWAGIPGLQSDVCKVSNLVMSGILEDEGASEVQEIIETASEETFHNTRKLLNRVRVDIFGHNHVIRIAAEVSGNDVLKTEAIFREYEAKALSPGHIFVACIGVLRLLHSGGQEASSLLETLKNTEEPLVNEKVERVLSDPAALKEAIQSMIQKAQHRKPTANGGRSRN